ncbi:TPA: hypothetical protein ACH3X2_002731 [Trebouxia sp. C0005]
MDALPEDWQAVPNEKEKCEEISRLTVPENLNDIDRATTLLLGGYPQQQKSVVDSFPALVRAKGKPAFLAVGNPLCVLLPTFELSLKVAAVEALTAVAESQLVAGNDIVELLLPSVLANINVVGSPDEVVNAWLKCFHAIVPLLDKTLIKAKILPVALAKGANDETSVQSRVICCAMLGSMAACLTKEEIERGYLRRAMTLCQDTDYIVRINMCDGLHCLAAAVGLEVTVATILPEIFELMKDEEPLVRVAAINSLVAVMGVLPADVRRKKAVPYCRLFFQSPDMESQVARCMASQFPSVLCQVVADIDNDLEVGVFLGAYRQLAQRQDLETRRLCAESCAAVLKAATPRRYATHVHEALTALVADPDQEVRRLMALQFHDICKMLGKERCAQYMKRPFLNLLGDESNAVRVQVMASLVQTLDQFCIANEEARTRAFADFLPALLAADAGCGYCWRIHHHLMLALPHFVHMFTSDEINEHFLPMALRYMAGGVAPVREAAADAVVVFMRHNRKQAQRTDIYCKLLRDYARAKSHWRRMTFIDACHHVVRRFSTKFFKTYFLDTCLELTADPVPNVRLHLTALLPALKQSIRLPEDVEQLERVNSAMSNLATDNDRDVAGQARAVNDLFKRTPVRMTGGAGLLDMNGLPGGHSSSSEDSKKEEEEADFTFSADDIEKLKNEEALLQKNKKVGNGDMVKSARAGPRASGPTSGPSKPRRSTNDAPALSALSISPASTSSSSSSIRSSGDSKSGPSGGRTGLGGRVGASSSSSGGADEGQWSIRATGGTTAPRLASSTPTSVSGQGSGDKFSRPYRTSPDQVVSVGRSAGLAGGKVAADKSTSSTGASSSGAAANGKAGGLTSNLNAATGGKFSTSSIPRR